MRSDHRHLTAYQISCEVRQSVVLVLRPAILDHDILALIHRRALLYRSGPLLSVAAIDTFAEEQVFKHPLYAPSLVEPPV